MHQLSDVHAHRRPDRLPDGSHHWSGVLQLPAKVGFACSLDASLTEGMSMRAGDGSFVRKLPVSFVRRP
jgi:hypothetical protein